MKIAKLHPSFKGEGDKAVLITGDLNKTGMQGRLTSCMLLRAHNPAATSLDV